MGVIQRLVRDIEAGWARLRYGTAHAATRALEETELLRLRSEIRKVNDRLNEIYVDIGERTVEMHEQGESTDLILKDHKVVQPLNQIVQLQSEQRRLQAEIDDLRAGQ